jgi:hypothetical protein
LQWGTRAKLAPQPASLKIAMRTIRRMMIGTRVDGDQLCNREPSLAQIAHGTASRRS